MGLTPTDPAEGRWQSDWVSRAGERGTLRPQAWLFSSAVTGFHFQFPILLSLPSQICDLKGPHAAPGCCVASGRPNKSSSETIRREKQRHQLCSFLSFPTVCLFSTSVSLFLYHFLSAKHVIFNETVSKLSVAGSCCADVWVNGLQQDSVTLSKWRTPLANSAVQRIQIVHRL